MKKVIKKILITIGATFVLLLGILCYSMRGFVGPMDGSNYRIKVLKTGAVDTLTVYTVDYKDGDTLYVYKEPGYNYRAASEYTSKTAKKQKAVILPQ